MPAPDPSYDASTFTTHDRERLVEVATTLGFVNTTLADIKKAMDTAASNARSDMKELEGRVRALENFRWWLLGGTAFANVAMQFIWKAMGK